MAEVLVATVRASPVEIVDELPGRVVAFRTAEIRPQVTGIVERRLFEQGAMVRTGQPLFQINPAPFRAEMDAADAALRRAAATYQRAQVQADRLGRLVGADAISRQSYDDAVVARDQARADVAAARAALARRRLDLGFSRVTSPISGRIGAAIMTEGALVSATQAEPLATVQQIDRVYIDVRQPADRFELLRDSVARGGVAAESNVEILSSSGRSHPVRGEILFSGVSVDEATGNAIVRVLVANPGERLLPGMFVRARLPRVTMPNALSVPQQAVTRDASGRPQVSLVDASGKIQTRAIEVGDVVDGRYVVLSGLQPGARIVVVGHDRATSGTTVKALPWRDGATSRR